MCRIDKFSNIHATYSYIFFQSTKLRQPTEGRDSCLKMNKYHIIFVISTIRYIPNCFSYEKPGTLSSYKVCIFVREYPNFIQKCLTFTKKYDTCIIRRRCLLLLSIGMSFQVQLKGRSAQTQVPAKQMKANVSLIAIAKMVFRVLKTSATPCLLILLLNTQVIFLEDFYWYFLL